MGDYAGVMSRGRTLTGVVVAVRRTEFSTDSWRLDAQQPLFRRQTGREDVEFQGFELYTLRHTCLTRWAPHPWTLAYLAGHRDMNITKRYVHPQEQTIRAAMDRAQVANIGHNSGHTAQKEDLENTPVTTPTI